MQNLNNLNNLNALGIKGNRLFDPSQITVGGEKLLLQQLLTKQRPTIDGIVYDERKNKGTARPVQLGRCYLFDGTNDYVTTPVIPPTSGSIEVEFIKGSATNKFLGGARDSTDTRCIIGYDSLNKPIGGIGSVSGTTMIGTTTLVTGTKYKLKLTWNGTFVFLYVNDVLEYSGNQVGSVGTVRPIYFGTFNDAGTPSTAYCSDKILTLKIYNGSTLQNFYKCDEQDGTIAYDSSGNGKHGTITNATLATFHATQDIYSYQNEVGYSKPSTVFIPRNEAIPTQDVTGATLQYSGQVPYNGILKSSSCILLNGTTQYASTGLNMNTLCQDTFSIDTIFSPTDGQGTTSVIFGSSDNAVFGTQGTDSNNGLGIYVLLTGKLAVLYKAGGNFARADTASVIFTDGAQTALRKFRFTLTAGSGITILEYINGAWVNLALDATNNGLFSTNSVVMSTFNHDVVGFIGGKNTAGTAYNFFGGKVALFECINASGVKYAQYKMSCGIGSGLCDSSGNSRNGLWYNAPTWSTQDNYHPNIVDGFGSRMYFDQTNDLITLTNQSNFNFTTKATIEIEGIFTAGVLGVLLNKTNGGGNGWQCLLENGKPRGIFSGSSVIDTTSTWAGSTDLRDGKQHKIKFIATLSSVQIYVDNILKNTTIGTWTPVPSTQAVTIGNYPSLSSPLGGFINYVKIWGDTDNLLYSSTGYGITNADWADTSGGGNNGTVTGSPSIIRIPAINATTDSMGYPLTNPAGAYHNGSETTIDMSGGVASPVAVIGSWTSAWSFNTARTNPKFKRTLTSGGVDKYADRFLAYRSTLSGSNLSKVNKYVTTKAI